MDYSCYWSSEVHSLMTVAAEPFRIPPGLGKVGMNTGRGSWPTEADSLRTENVQ